MEAYDDFACALDEEEQESIKLGAIGEFQYAPSIYTIHENETSNECIRQSISSTPSHSQIKSKLNLLSCTITSFYHGQITKKEATFRLRNSPVGSFLLRSIQPPNKKCLSYVVSYSLLHPHYLHTRIMHTSLDSFIRPGGSLQEAMSELDPNGKFLLLPVHPNKSYKQARVQTWECDQCKFKATSMESFIRHKDEEKMLMSLTPLPNVQFINCEKCDFKTVLMSEFASHMKKAHPQNPKIRLVNKIEKVCELREKKRNRTGTETGEREWIIKE